MIVVGGSALADNYECCLNQVFRMFFTTFYEFSFFVVSRYAFVVANKNIVRLYTEGKKKDDKYCIVIVVNWIFLFDWQMGTIDEIASSKPAGQDFSIFQFEKSNIVVKSRILFKFHMKRST